MRFLLSIFIAFFLAQTLQADTRFLTISDIHYGSDNTPADDRDTDNELLATTLNKLKLLVKGVDFVITLGDFPTHLLMSTPKKESCIATVFQGLYKADSTNKPMFYITGNNDSLHGNYQPFSWNGKSPLTLAKNWQGACIHCDGLIIDGSHMQEMGYYSSYVIPNNKNIILIALNSTQFVNLPFYIPHYPNQHKDALQQLHWLEQQLKKHHTNQLLIAMHIPPGINYKGQLLWKKNYLKQFISLLERTHQHYGEINLLTGHTHMDDIRKIHLKNEKTFYTYSTPSISRLHHNYPAMKVFYLNTQMKLKDYTTYYTTTNNKWGEAHYNAIQGSTSIFAQCHGQILKKCLDNLTNKAICKNLHKGQFYGVKSPKVDSLVCALTFPVN